MGADDHHTNGDSSLSYSTNWTITRGSLETSITFESSDDDSNSESTSQISPLILHPPSPDSPPCEIKLCFMQKHEIRQVYVRSTARVYEIYCAPTLQSDNDYLCTVRCGIAERDGEFLRAGGVEVVTQQYMKDYVGKPPDDGVTAEAKLCSSEDDWVEVKVSDSPFVGNRVSCLQNQTIGSEGRNAEDLYEATAQISDTDPCMSLTIRFLSLQNKGSVCIDEVYIFGDPIHSNEIETPVVRMGNQASSFMAMLVPTLLQLSKSGISQKQDNDVFDSHKKENKVGIAARTSDYANANEENGLEQDKDSFNSQTKENKVGVAEKTSDYADGDKENDQEKRMSADHLVPLDVTDKPIAEPTHSQPLNKQNLSRENHNISTMNRETSTARIERALEQLLDRVSRIENICLKFEENMVSPINSMEMRLQRLEQQVEILAKNSQQSGVAPCTRITVPSFTCSESNSSSLYNDGSENGTCGASKVEKNDLPCNKSCIRISAPSFSYSESNSRSWFNDERELQPCCGACVPSQLEENDLPCNNSCRRITVPSFSCSESNSSSLYYDGCENRHHGASAVEKDIPSDVPASSNTLDIVPNLMITAPEFSCGEYEEENDIAECAKASSQEMQKQVMSIDDALAAALSGFLSTSHVLPPNNGTPEVIASGSTSEVVNEKNEFPQYYQGASVSAHDCSLEENGEDIPSKYTQILAVAAPDFSEEEYEFESPNFIVASSATAPELANEEHGNNEIASPSSESHDPGGFTNLNRSKSMHDASSTVASGPYGEQEKFLHENVQLKGTSGIIGSEENLLAQESVCRSQDDVTACPSDQGDKVAETNVKDSTNEPQMNSHHASKGSHVDVMLNVCEYVKPSTLDFDIPLLDVKFAGNEDGDAKFSLEVLLGGMAEENEAPAADENTDNGVTSEGITFSVMEELPKCCAGNGNPLLDYGTNAADTFTNLDGHSNPKTSNCQEFFIGLL